MGLSWQPLSLFGTLISPVFPSCHRGLRGFSGVDVFLPPCAQTLGAGDSSRCYSWMGLVLMSVGLSLPQAGKHQEYEQKLLQELYKMNPSFLQTSAPGGEKSKGKSSSLQRYHSSVSPIRPHPGPGLSTRGRRGSAVVSGMVKRRHPK